MANGLTVLGNVILAYVKHATAQYKSSRIGVRRLRLCPLK